MLSSDNVGVTQIVDGAAVVVAMQCSISSANISHVLQALYEVTLKPRRKRLPVILPSTHLQWFTIRARIVTHNTTDAIWEQCVSYERTPGRPCGIFVPFPRPEAGELNLRSSSRADVRVVGNCFISSVRFIPKRTRA